MTRDPRRLSLRVMWLAIQVCIALPMALLLFWLLPWLGSHPMSELPAEERASAPASARSWRADHGRYVYASHATVAEEPGPFFARAGLFVGLAGLLIVAVGYPKAPARRASEPSRDS